MARKKKDPTAGRQPLRVPASHFPQARPSGPSALSGGVSRSHPPYTPPSPPHSRSSPALPLPLVSLDRTPRSQVSASPKPFPVQVATRTNKICCSLKHCFLGNAVLRLPSFFDCSRKTTLPSMPSKRKADPGSQLHVTSHYGFTVLCPAVWWSCVIWYLSVAG